MFHHCRAVLPPACRRAAESDGLCSLVLRSPCQWVGALYNAVGPVLPVNLTSVLSANETLEAWEAVATYFGWGPPPPPPSPPPVSPPPPSPSPPVAQFPPPSSSPAAKAPPPRANSSAGSPPPQAYTGAPVVTIGRRLQALAKRVGSLLGGGSSSGSSAGAASSSGDAAGSSDALSGSSGSRRRLQQDLLTGDPYTFESMSDAWSGAMSGVCDRLMVWGL